MIMFHDKFVCLLSKPNIEFIEQIIFIKHGHDIDFDRNRSWNSDGVIDSTDGANHAAVDEQMQSFCRKPWQHNQVPFAGRNRDEFCEVTAIRGCNNGYQATAYLNFEFHSTTKKGDETPILSGAIRELEPCGNSQAWSAGLQVGATRAGTEVNGGSTGRCNSDDMGWKVEGVLHKTRRYRPHCGRPKYHGAGTGADLTRVHTGTTDYCVTREIPSQVWNRDQNE